MFTNITLSPQPQVFIQVDIMNGNISTLKTDRVSYSSPEKSLSNLQAPLFFHLRQCPGVLSSTGLGSPLACGYLGLIWGVDEAVTLDVVQHTIIRLAFLSNPHGAMIRSVGLSRRLGHLSSVTHSVRNSPLYSTPATAAQLWVAIVVETTSRGFMSPMYSVSPLPLYS